jgi:S1-C subfamily serine protease
VLRNDGKDAVILTAAHCTKRFQTKLPDGTETTLPIPVTADLGKEAACPGTLGGISLARDLAIITVEKCALPTVVAQLATAPPKLGDVAYAVGHPAAANYILTKGIISRPATMFGNTRYMLVSAPIIFGNSGGPVFNTRGEVIGVNTNVGVVKVRLGDGSTIPAYVAVPHLGLVVPLDEVKAFLRAGGFADLAK